MLPYVHVPDLQLGPLTLHPFGLLVATGVIVGTSLATGRARRLGLDLDRLNSFITWMLVGGFIGGHVLDELFYHPSAIVRRWWSLFALWEGLSSFGGFTGALIGVLLWKHFNLTPRWAFERRLRPSPILPFCDVILAVFPVAWIFGRSACATVHDHPGARLSEVHDLLNGALAVAYPGPQDALDPEKFALFHGSVPRFDLGLLEMLFTCVVAFCFALSWRKRLPTGTYVVVASLAYAPVRFAMDFLRIPPAEDPANADLRYGVGAIALTPAQWECIALFIFGIWVAIYVRSLRRRGTDPMGDVMAPPSVVPRPPAFGREM
jgi:phosphatidylglycerol---prolipoprotein diacylglyceryl transferase